MAYISMGEAHRKITDYLNNFSDAIATQDGASLRRLLSLSSGNTKLLAVADALNVFQVFFSILGFYSNFEFDPLIHSNFIAWWKNLNFPLVWILQDVSRLIRQSSEMLSPLLRALQCYKLGQLVDAYNSYEKFSK